MNLKSITIACMLASCAFAATAAATKNVKQTVTDLGTLNYVTDYMPGGNGTVTYTVPSGQPAGSYDVFTDIYSFSVNATYDVSASVQVVGNNKQFSLTGGKGEVALYEGVYTIGSSLSAYTLVDELTFDAAGESLDDHIAGGKYFYAIEGTTSGTKGGKYQLEVTAVPEPTPVVLMLAGLGLFATISKRRKIR